MFVRSHRLLAAVVVIVTALPVAAQVTTTTTTSSTTTSTTLLLCPPAQNPCTITGGSTVAAGVYDIRPRDLLLTLGTSTIDTTGNLTVMARNITFQAGARLLSPGPASAMSGGTVELDADGTITMQSTGVSKSRIDATGFFSGGFVSLTANGNVTINGALVANGTSRDGGGGEVDVTSTMGDVSITGDGVVAKGGDRFGGGSAFLEATLGNLTLDAPATAANGDCSGCEIDLTAGTNIVTTLKGDVDVSASNVGDGGTIDIESSGDCTLNGQLLGDAAGNSTDGGGAGADVTVASDTGNLAITDRIEVNGHSPDGDAGTIDLSANGTLVQSGPMFALSTGFGGGALVSWDSTGNVTVGSVDTSGDTDAGSIFATSTSLLTITGAVKAVLLNPALTPTPFGGDCDFEACQINVPSGTQITCQGPDPVGRNTYIAGSTAVTIAGKLIASDGNWIQWRTGSPPKLTGSSITPAPVITQNPQLPCCGVNCTTTTTTTTSTTTTTRTTTTSIGATTSTTVATTTSMTATTLAGSTTTSTTTSTTHATTTTVSSSTSTSKTTTTTTSTTFTTTTTTSTSTTRSTTTSTTTTSSTSTTTSTTVPHACASAPVAGCRVAAKASVVVNETSFGKEQLKVVLERVSTPVGQSDFGNPITGDTAYEVCLYDHAGALVDKLKVDQAGALCSGKPCWKVLSTVGYKYTDKLLEAAGVKEITLTGGAPGKAKAIIKGKNDLAHGETDLPTHVARKLVGDRTATVQLLTSDGACFTATVTNVTQADGIVFKGTLP
jgi:hypothetical protein